MQKKILNIYSLKLFGIEELGNMNVLKELMMMFFERIRDSLRWHKSSKESAIGFIDTLVKATEDRRYKWHKGATGIYRTYFPDEKYLLEVFPDTEPKLFVTDGRNESLEAKGDELLEGLVRAVCDSLNNEDPDKELSRILSEFNRKKGD